MKRSTYAAFYASANLVALSVYLWLLAGTVSTGVAERLPKKNAASYTIAVFAILLAGVLQQSLRPLGNARRGLSVKTVTTLVNWLRLVGLVSLARFVLPLMTTGWGMFSRKPDVSATALWFGILYSALTLRRLIPVYLKHALPSAEEVMMNDSRKPVLYLRSFHKEVKKVRRVFSWSRGWRTIYQNQGGSYVSPSRRPAELFFSDRARLGRLIGSGRKLDEQMVLAQTFEKIGPYIAIGRPNEGYRDMDLGAAKKYVADDEWQDVVRQWLEKCAAVVLEAGDSAGLGWEIEQVVLLVPPQHVILICPYSDEEYQSFLQAHFSRFPHGLPTTRPTSRLLIFDSDWRPRKLNNSNFNADETLAPFFAQVGVSSRRASGNAM